LIIQPNSCCTVVKRCSTKLQHLSLHIGRTVSYSSVRFQRQKNHTKKTVVICFRIFLLGVTYFFYEKSSCWNWQTSAGCRAGWAATKERTNTEADGPDRWLAAARRAGRRHIWPALRRNLIFNLRTVGHMRLLKRRAAAAATAADQAGPGGCRLKLLAHVACRQRRDETPNPARPTSASCTLLLHLHRIKWPPQRHRPRRSTV